METQNTSSLRSDSYFIYMYFLSLLTSLPLCGPRKQIAIEKGDS